MLINESKLEFLERVDVFHNIGFNGLNEIYLHSDRITVEKGDYIYQTLEPTNKVYFLLDGRVKIGAFTSDGKEIIKRIVNPGEMFGEMAILQLEHHPNFALCLDSESTFLAVEAAYLKKLMNIHPTLMFNITKELGQRLLNTEKRLESLVSKDVKSRIIELILDLGQKVGKKIGDEILIRHQLTHQDIANLTATSRQTVTTVLNELRDKNHIYFERKKILIHDPKKLAKEYGIS